MTIITDAISHESLKAILADEEASPFDLSQLNIEEFDFSGRQLQDLTADSARFSRCSFRAAELYGSRWIDGAASACDFSNAVLGKSEFRRFDLRDCVFDGAMLNRAILVECDLRGCSFRGADLSYATFANCDLRGALFPRALREVVQLNDCRIDEVTWS